MTKDEKGVWTCTSDPQVVGFHYYSIWIDSVTVMDRNTQAYFGSNWESSGIEIPEGPEGDYYRFNKTFLMDKFTPFNIGRKLMVWNVIVMFIFLLNMSRIEKRNIRYCTYFTVGVRMKQMNLLFISTG